LDSYSGNPFRVLGLRSDASGKEAGRTADRLLKWIELGEIPQVEEALPYLASLRRSREQIKQAINEIEDPRARIRAELYWPSSRSSVYETCEELLKGGRYAAFVSQCEKVIADGFTDGKNHRNSHNTLETSLNCHFLAVFYHSAAITLSRGLSKTPPDGNPPVDWDRAFKYWDLVIKDDLFWKHLADRAVLLNDARIDESDIQRFRRELPLELLRVNVSRAAASFEGGQSDDFVANCGIIRMARFGANTDKALKEITVPLQSNFEKAIREIRSSVSETAIRAQVPAAQNTTANTEERGLDPNKLTAYLAGVEGSINKSLVPLGQLVKEAGLEKTEPAPEILDGVAYAFRSLSLAFNNYGGMPHASVRLTKAGKEYAATTECKDRLDEDYQTLQFLSLQKDASELAGASRYKESLDKLEAARQFASSDQERQTIDEWVKLAKKRLVLEGVKQIDSPPTMYTINGIGTRLYGKRNFDAQSQSYVATLYFTFFYVPIFPFSSYRVSDAGGNRYNFLGKVPLKWTAFIAPAVVALIIAFFMIQGNTDTTPSSPVQDAPSGSVGTATPTQSPSSDKESLGQWIDQERARLRSDQSELDSDGSRIDTDHRSIDQRADELNAGNPSQEETDSYEASRQRFNSEVQAFNARVAKHKADVARFNAEVSRYNGMP
jgi:hypothetical protein